MPDRAAQCPRCGKRIDPTLPYCPHCGAPSDRKADDRPPAGADGGTSNNKQKNGGGNVLIKALLAVVVLCAVALGALLVVYLDGDRPEAGMAAASPTSDIRAQLATVPPSPTPQKPTPVPAQVKVLGTWVATRIENNTKKSKEILMETTLGDTRTRILFLSDGTASILVDQLEGLGLQAEERPWYANGGDIFIDKGEEMIDGEAMVGRNRFFFKDDLLYCVYTLDGREVTDFVVYSRSEPPEAAPASPSDSGG